MQPVSVAPPQNGLWRIGRHPDPLSPSFLESDLAQDSRRTGNRFDSPTRTYGVCYLATSPNGCYGETLARFRPDPLLIQTIGDEWRARGWMKIGSIPADWRQRRTLLRAEVRCPDGEPCFLDVEALDTREYLRVALADQLTYFGYRDLDISDVRSRDRRITRLISQWAFESQTPDGRDAYSGIRYLSRLNSDWECWAVFDRADIEEISRRPILVSDRDYRRVAKSYNLTPH